MKILKIKDTTWVSLQNPSREEIQDLSQRFPGIHRVVLEELLTPTIRPRVDNYEQYLYLVLHFPDFLERTKETITHEIDFILTQNAIITVQYEDMPALESFWHECEDKTIEKDHCGKTPVHLFYHLLEWLFDDAMGELDEIQKQIDAIEKQVFDGRQKELLYRVSHLRRQVLNFRRAIQPEQLALQSLALQGATLYGESAKPFLNDLVGEFLKVWNHLENHKETLDALFDTANALIAFKTNETMKAFTILAFITFIPTAIANIYGMNVERFPFASGPNAFWNIVGIMAAFTLIVYFLLKWRKLL